MPAASYLVDTNILLRLVQTDSPEHESIQQCTEQLWMRGASLYYTPQNLAEFWNVCTRPAARNGLGCSVAETERRARTIEAILDLAPDHWAIHQEWRGLVFTRGVSGAQVHDARPVAAMYVHGIEVLLTLNARDFRRYTGIRAVSPAEALAGMA